MPLYFVVKIVPALAMGSSFSWLLCLFDRPHCVCVCKIHFLSSTTRCSSPTFSHLSKGPWFLLLENGIFNTLQVVGFFFIETGVGKHLLSVSLKYFTGLSKSISASLGRGRKRGFRLSKRKRTKAVFYARELSNPALGGTCLPPGATGCHVRVSGQLTRAGGAGRTEVEGLLIGGGEFIKVAPRTCA